VGRSVLGAGASEAPLRRADAPWLAAIVVFGGVMGPLLLMLGLARTSAASGSLLLNLEGLATMAIAWVVFRENVDRDSCSVRLRSFRARSRCRGKGRGYASTEALC
jgi:drug/metabolite transporter (DMT)-like permease